MLYFNLILKENIKLTLFYRENVNAPERHVCCENTTNQQVLTLVDWSFVITCVQRCLMSDCCVSFFFEGRGEGREGRTCRRKRHNNSVSTGAIFFFSLPLRVSRFAFAPRNLLENPNSACRHDDELESLSIKYILEFKHFEFAIKAPCR